jgi:hypothetical protein
VEGEQITDGRGRVIYKEGMGDRAKVCDFTLPYLSSSRTRINLRAANLADDDQVQGSPAHPAMITPEYRSKQPSLPQCRAPIGPRLSIPNYGILLSCMAGDLSSIITLFPLSVYAWCDRWWFCGAEQESPSKELWSLVVCTPQRDNASVVRGDATY